MKSIHFSMLPILLSLFAFSFFGEINFFGTLKPHGEMNFSDTRDQMNLIVTEPAGTIEVIGDAGSPNVFTFKKWEFGNVSMADGQVENIEAEIIIYTGSLETSWKELQESVKKKKDYFFVKKFPKATVSIKGARANEDGSYTTDALLTLKGISKEVPLTFTIDGNQVQGEGLILRRQFKFTGDGPKDEVPLRFDVELPL